MLGFHWRAGLWGGSGNRQWLPAQSGYEMVAVTYQQDAEQLAEGGDACLLQY
jgi:hypothetical protein